MSSRFQMCQHGAASRVTLSSTSLVVVTVVAILLQLLPVERRRLCPKRKRESF